MSIQKRGYRLQRRGEQQQATRRRIVEATVELHEELGPARTTIAEIARRAGVARLTVYNHFPDDRQLFAACQRHYLSTRTMPDFRPGLALQEPRASVETVLTALYRNYRARQPMLGQILRDRSAIPALDALLRDTLDAELSDLRKRLRRRLPARGRQAKRVAAALAVALDFATWQHLARAGLDDDGAAKLMRQLVMSATDTDARDDPPSSPGRTRTGPPPPSERPGGSRSQLGG